MNLQEIIEQKFMKEELPSFEVGDTVKVHLGIKEGDRERIQVFEGIVIRRKGGGVRETFTVRKVIGGEGVERIFPLHSPVIKKITVVRRGKVRRAKLYYLRGKVGKATRVKERKSTPTLRRKETLEANVGKEEKKGQSGTNPGGER